MTSSESKDELPAITTNAAVSGMVKTLKSLLDAAIRERLRLETLLEQVQETTTRLETLMDQSENRLEQWRSERERLAALSTSTATFTAATPVPSTAPKSPWVPTEQAKLEPSPCERTTPVRDATVDAAAAPSTVFESRSQTGQAAVLPGQVAALRERVRSWEQERGTPRREPTSQIATMLRDGATAAQIAEKLQIPIGEVELMARLSNLT
ncbi:MAG: hypothetical protein PHE53_05495 [Thermoguttaceae bacterium]|nr:hypothetical protein [Thermoguttaceae bacterium]